MTEKYKKNEEIDLLEIVKALLRRWWAMLIAVIIFGTAAFGYTHLFIRPQYKASTLLYVNNSSISLGSASLSISNADLTAAQKLVNTYVVILKSRSCLNEVIRTANLNCSYEKLKSMISAASVNSTEVFEVIVTSTDPAEAERIANTIAYVVPDKIADIVKGSDVRIVDYAVVPAHRSSPSYTRNTAIGMLIGLIISAVIIILAFYLDENIRSEDYLTQTYPDIPLLSVIPDMASSKHSGGYYGYGDYSYRRHSSKTAGSRKSGSKTESTGADSAETDKGGLR